MEKVRKMKKIRFYINTSKNPLIDVELTGIVEVESAIWDLMNEPHRRKVVEREFFKKSQMSFEEEVEEPTK